MRKKQRSLNNIAIAKTTIHDKCKAMLNGVRIDRLMAHKDISNNMNIYLLNKCTTKKNNCIWISTRNKYAL